MKLVAIHTTLQKGIKFKEKILFLIFFKDSHIELFCEDSKPVC